MGDFNLGHHTLMDLQFYNCFEFVAVVEKRASTVASAVRPTAFDVVMANQARQGREEQFLVPGDFNQGRTGTVAVAIAAVGVVLAATAGGQSYQNYVERVRG